MSGSDTPDVIVRMCATLAGWKEAYPGRELCAWGTLSGKLDLAVVNDTLTPAGQLALEGELLEAKWTLGKRVGNHIWRSHNEISGQAETTVKDKDRAAATMAAFVTMRTQWAERSQGG